MLIALVAGLTLLALAIGVTLSRAPLTPAGTNSILPRSEIGIFAPCQRDQSLPRGTTAVRLWLKANIGPSVTVTVLSGSRVLTRGTREAGWTGAVVTVAVGRLSRAVAGASVCVRLGPAVQPVSALGGPASSGAGGEASEVRIEYLRPGPSSWWSLASSVAWHVGLGRAPGGADVFLLPLALMALATILASWTIARVLVVSARGRERERAKTIRERHDPRVSRGARFAGRVPGPAWACACVAFLSAASWSILSPPFQVTDETAHFAYVQVLAETGRLPVSEGRGSQEEAAVLEALDQQAVNYNPAVGTISTVAQQRSLERVLRARLSRRGTGAGVASPQPPVYYALATIPYELAAGGTLLDQLEAMRLLSALLAALTAFFGYLFLREALPATPWAWIVGGLALALAPLLGYISGAVTPDAMLCTVCTALFYCLARAFRRGLTPPIAIAIGAVSAIGFLTKLNFIGLAPGLLLALLLLTRRARPGRSAYRSLALALAIAAAPVCVYTLVNVLSGHAGLGLASKGIGQTSEHEGSPLQELAYIWQLYLPRLPGMPADLPGVSALRQLWFDRSVGLYGWLDTYFSPRVENLALIAAVLLAGLCARALVLSRATLRARADELLAYTAMGGGLLVLIGADSYLEFPGRAGGYIEPRYLLPLAALFAAALALAARGAGRRWGPAAGALIVVLFLAHDLFSQLLVVGRYYA